MTKRSKTGKFEKKKVPFSADQQKKVEVKLDDLFEDPMAYPGAEDDLHALHEIEFDEDGQPLLPFNELKNKGKQYYITIKGNVWIAGFDKGKRNAALDRVQNEGPLVFSIKTDAQPQTEEFNEHIRRSALEQYANNFGYNIVIVPFGKTPSEYDVSKNSKNLVSYAVSIDDGNDTTDYIAEMRIREINAPLIQRFGLDDWSITDGGCTLDYIWCKFGSTRITREKIATLLFPTGNDGQGAKFTDFCNCLNALNINYWIVAPNNKLLEKHIEDEHYHKSAYMYLNNNHLYPIECPNLQRQIAKCSIGDLCIDTTINKKLINYQSATYTEMNLSDLVYQKFKKDNVLPDRISIEGGHITAVDYANELFITNNETEVVRQFITQMNDQIAKFNKVRFSVDQQKKIEEKSINKVRPIQFYNQSLQSVAYESLAAFGFNIPYDCMNSSVSSVFFSSSLLIPYVEVLEDYNEMLKELQAVDVKGTHKQILTQLGFKHGFPIYTYYDEIKPYRLEEIRTGLYYVNKVVKLHNKVIINPNWLDANLISYLLLRGYIVRSDISLQLTSTYSVSIDVFQKLESSIAACDIDIMFKKAAINNLCGLFGSYTGTKQTGFCTSDAQLVQAYYSNFTSVQQLGDGLYLVCESLNYKKKNNRALWYSVICQEYIALDLLLEAVKPRKIESIRTDSVYFDEELGETGFRGLFELPEDPRYKIEVRNEYVRPSSLVVKPTVQDYSVNEQKKIEWQNTTLEEVLTNKESFMLTGGAGSGKTYTTINQILPNITGRLLICSVAYKALIKYKAVVLTMNQQSDILVCAKLFDNQFVTLESIAKRYDVIIVDEFSMVSSKYMGYFYELHKLGVRIILIGDDNQLPGVEEAPRRHSDHEFVREMCSCNLVTLQYTQFSRFDKPLHELLECFLATNRVTLDKTQKLEQFSFAKQYIAYTNRKCDVINKNAEKLLSKMTEEQQAKAKRYIANDTVTHLDVTIYNNEMFANGILSDNKLMLKSLDRDLTICYDDFNEALNPAYCITVHRSQGATYTMPVVICESQRMSKEMLYVAMSRATSLTNLEFYNAIEAKEYCSINFSHPTLPICKYKQQTGFIYALRKSIIADGSNAVFYIGQTTDVEGRREQHLAKYPGCSMEVINVVKYDHVAELLRKEYEAVLDHCVKNEPHGLVNVKLVERAMEECKKMSLVSLKPKQLYERHETSSSVTIHYLVGDKKHTKRFQKAKLKNIEDKINKFMKSHGLIDG